VEAVVDICPQRVQRHLTLAIELRAAHFCTTQTSRALNSNAAGAGAHGTLLCFAHSAAELHAGRELLGYALSDQLGIGFRVLDFEMFS
jgi:hypothetical protein